MHYEKEGWVFGQDCLIPTMWRGRVVGPKCRRRRGVHLVFECFKMFGSFYQCRLWFPCRPPSSPEPPHHPVFKHRPSLCYIPKWRTEWSENVPPGSDQSDERYKPLPVFCTIIFLAFITKCHKIFFSSIFYLLTSTYLTIKSQSHCLMLLKKHSKSYVPLFYSVSTEMHPIKKMFLVKDLVDYTVDYTICLV